MEKRLSNEKHKPQVLFVWTGLTSYMSDCWRRLAADSWVELKLVIAVDERNGTGFKASEVLRGLDYTIVSAREKWDPASIGFRPDFVFAVGWHVQACRDAVMYAPWAEVPKVCCFDMPWRWKLRCLLAPLALCGFLRHYRAAFVPGAVCARYAKWLGFGKIYRGLFAIDTGKFGAETADSARAYFLYLGRNSSEKRIGDIVEAHRQYRERGGKLPLKLYGKGLKDGFVGPDAVPGIMRDAAAIVLASEFDPWPLVLLEAMSAGCPVIASDRCKNRPELGRNWRVFRCGDVKALAQAMWDAEDGVGGEKENLELARQYDCKAWVGKVKTIIEELVR